MASPRDLLSCRGASDKGTLFPHIFFLYVLRAYLRCWDRWQRRIKCKEYFPVEGESVSHLLFADDSLLFCQTTIQECQHLLHILSQYEEASRQAINRQKKQLYSLVITSQEVKEDIRTMLGAQIMTKCERYLGLSMVGGKSKVATFKEIM